MNNCPLLQKEFEYFIANLPELLKQYEGKFIVIKNEKVMGAYDTFALAITETTKSEKLGTFLVQKCVPGEENYKQVYHSRVSFIN
jgi:hypothetical protein